MITKKKIDKILKKEFPGVKWTDWEIDEYSGFDVRKFNEEIDVTIEYDSKECDGVHWTYLSAMTESDEITTSESSSMKEFKEAVSLLKEDLQAEFEDCLGKVCAIRTLLKKDS